MNSKERYMAMVRGKEVDFIPRIPIVMQFAAEYIGSNYGKLASDYRTLVQANVACAKDFGFDQLSLISDPYRETQGFGGKVEYIPDGVPRCTAPLENSKDLADLKRPDPQTSERMRDRLDGACAYAKDYGQEYSIMGWVEGPAAEAADLRGVMNFLMDVMDDEGFVEALMDRCLETAIEFARAQILAGCDTIGIGDAIASQLSPDIYEKMVQPREAKLVEAIQSAGGIARLHICGNITHLLPGIAEMGVDILDVDHMVDMAAAREAVGGDCVLAGNLDPVEAVKNGAPEGIRAAVREIVETVGLPCMVNAGCEIPSGTPEANLKALCEPLMVENLS
ncbi:MAG: uroporphyrinogen decarboxylase family protein [Candidatus Sumerlaeia bacterium]